FMAAAIIAKQPQLFGFELEAFEPAFAYEEVTLPKNWPYVDLVAAAKILDIKYAALRDLNPELRQAITPPSADPPYRLRVPPDKGAFFLEKYARLPSAQKASIYQYEVQDGDNISSIAKAFGINTRTIAAANSLKNPNLIRPKQILYIPAAPGIELSASKGRDQTQRTYTVRPGDSLDRIARQNEVRLRDLMRWNKLDKTLIRPGQKLVLWKLQPRRPVPTISDGKGRKIYTVQLGDTLWDLARRFKISVNDLQAWNGLNNANIKPGQQLAIVDKSVYTVVQGDTLYSIARKFGLEPNEIARQNNISLSSTLLAGTTLQIPK
ncbi:MAG TPA: LysM peptidoglycan-binding domain-containing protein, partial [Candidatus Handelsmanbacteria bacterium]|nr:LysM peptidoglycan-binding domain-containing protein [Candidatus Handelsmanbacteria bacterium]